MVKDGFDGLGRDASKQACARSVDGAFLSADNPGLERDQE
jgi:hypothetical protein